MTWGSIKARLPWLGWAVAALAGLAALVVGRSRGATMRQAEAKDALQQATKAAAGVEQAAARADAVLEADETAGARYDAGRAELEKEIGPAQPAPGSILDTLRRRRRDGKP